MTRAPRNGNLGGMLPKTEALKIGSGLRKPRLVILSGHAANQRISLSAEPTLLLGSSPKAKHCIPELRENHAQLNLDPKSQELWLIDLSGGDTRINGMRIQEAQLKAGDMISLGPIDLLLEDDGTGLSALPSRESHFGPAIGKSPPMRKLFGMLEAVAHSESSLLFWGETGSGKDVLARAVHLASERRDKAFHVLDCGALAPSVAESELFGHERGAYTGAEAQRQGAFELADGGTLFLDEIGELPLDVQPKLLRALDQREIRRVGGNRPISVNVRILAATVRNLADEVERGRFREDLYFRLAVLPIHVPPLRTRKEDIPLLVEHFRQNFSKHRRHSVPPFDEQEVERLFTHDWPGNVRELKNTVERALWLAGPDQLPRFYMPALDMDVAEVPNFDPNMSYTEHMTEAEARFESTYLAWLMARSDGNISQAARLGRTDRKHLRRLLRKYDLLPEGSERSKSTNQGA